MDIFSRIIENPNISKIWEILKNVKDMYQKLLFIEHKERVIFRISSEVKSLKNVKNTSSWTIT